MNAPVAVSADAATIRPKVLRIRFSKHGKIRFTSHRDVARIWARTLRRVGLPVAYSNGFSPRPRISFGLALPTGYESDAEYLDVMCDPARPFPHTDKSLAQALTSALPVGMAVSATEGIDRSRPSLQQAVRKCTWRIEASGLDMKHVKDAVTRALAAEVLLIERKRKGRVIVDDMRPAVVSVQVTGVTDDGVRLVAELGTQPRTTRPSELLSSLHPLLRELRVCRLHQWIATDSGEWSEPIAAAESSVAGSEAAR